MNRSPIDLYERLPAVYRQRDAEKGYPLRALLEIISDQANIVKHDIEGLLDDFFIQTCDDWVIPYIGDLVGNNTLHEVAQRRRADVAKTIYYRRRKGTLPIIEEIARDVTGWGAHAVEFFELMEWTQNLNHLRYRKTENSEGDNPAAVDRVGTVNLRNHDAVDRVDGPFDVLAHSADIRPPSSNGGWHNISNVGIFLWRLQRYEVTGVPARPTRENDYGFYFSPLGHDIPLFTDPEREDDPTGLAAERHVPAPIRRLAFEADTEQYYGRTSRHSLAVSGAPNLLEESVVPASDIVCMDLDDWVEPPDGKVGIDVERGRIVFSEDYEVPGELFVSYNYGFSGDIGGGPYDRRSRLTRPDEETWHAVVAKEPPDPEPDDWYSSIRDAVQDWNPSRYSKAVVEIDDNRVYRERLDFEIDRSGVSLEIRAANRRRPILRPVIRHLQFDADAGDVTLTLSGLLVEGRSLQFTGGFEEVRVVDSTLIPGLSRNEEGGPVSPGRPSVTSDGVDAHCSVVVERSIVGPVILDSDAYTLEVNDSIIHAPPNPGGDRLPAVAGRTAGDAAGPPLTLRRSTVIGSMYAQSVPLATETIFADPVTVERRQEGCIRFSYVPPASDTPRRYQCQPDLAVEERSGEYDGAVPEEEKEKIHRRLQPLFTATRYGHPAYAQLSLNCPEELRTGGEDGAEMGVFNHLKQPQRESNLRTRLREYLPFGLEPGLIYVT